jgi:hypothetical protein
VLYIQQSTEHRGESAKDTQQQHLRHCVASIEDRGEQFQHFALAFERLHLCRAVQEELNGLYLRNEEAEAVWSYFEASGDVNCYRVQQQGTGTLPQHCAYS